MKTCLIVFSLCFVLLGCTNLSTDTHTIDTADGISIIPSIVKNPYPQCTGALKGLRIANLSKPRGLRVYLEEGQLCQRPL